MKMQRIIACAMLLLSAVFAADAGYGHAGTIAIGMVTGSKTGTYIAIGREIAAVASKDGLNINVYDSGGSIDNIKRITSPEHVGLAIVQSDVLGFLSRSKSPNSIATAHKLRLVAPLYNEEVHILARKNIATLADLNGKRVVVGSEGSGSMITAVNLFSLLGITPGKMYEIEPPHGAASVLSDDVDAMVFVGGKPVKMFKNMENLLDIKGPNAGKIDQVHFLPVNDPRLEKEYKSSTITHDDYSFVPVDQPVPTIAVTAMLITYDYSVRKDAYYREQCRNMGILGKALRDHLSELKAEGHPKWKEVDLNANVGDWKRDVCSVEAKAAGAKKSEAAAGSSDGTLEKDLLGVVRSGNN